MEIFHHLGLLGGKRCECGGRQPSLGGSLLQEPEVAVYELEKGLLNIGKRIGLLRLVSIVKMRNCQSHAPDSTVHCCQIYLASGVGAHGVEAIPYLLVDLIDHRQLAVFYVVFQYRKSPPQVGIIFMFFGVSLIGHLTGHSILTVAQTIGNLS